MKRMLFNATHQEELRVAIVDGQKLIDLDIETAGREQRKGNIYKGVITRIEPGLEACFVNYGEDRHGFLPFKEVARTFFKEGVDVRTARIQDALREGQELIVQVEKEERGNKGAALTTFISLAGRYLVLMPNNPRGGGVSRRVEGEDRQELRETMEQLQLPQGMSIIARTAGIGRNVEELQWDLSYLMQLWTAIDGAARDNPAPILIYLESSLVIRAIRDYFSPEIGEILIDTDEIADQAIAFMSVVMPDNVQRVKRYRDDIPLFSRFQIEHQIETAYSRTVQLPSGGAVVIDHTEALVAVDVNSARSTRGADIEETALRTNEEAADEVARQLRLRDLGGLIVIDFIDMEESKNQRAVEQRLRDALHFDRARVQMGKISRFGLMELSRQRLRPALNEGSHITCPRCNGTGVIRDAESSALHILRLLQEEAMKENTAAIHAQVPVDVATFLLNEKRSDIAKMEARLKINLVLIPNKHLETPHHHIERLRHDDPRLEEVRTSFDLAEAPATDTPFQPKEHEAASRPEALVKGITPSQPAPMSSTPKTRGAAASGDAAPGLGGLFKKIVGWLTGEPAAKVAQPVVAESTEGKRPARSRSRTHDGQDRRGERHGSDRSRGGRRSPEARSETADSATTTAEAPRSSARGARRPEGERGERNERGDRTRNDRPPREDRDTTAQPNLNVAPRAAAPEADEGSQGRSGRSRRGRGRNRREDTQNDGPLSEQESMVAALAQSVAEALPDDRASTRPPRAEAQVSAEDPENSAQALGDVDENGAEQGADPERKRRRRRSRRGRRSPDDAGVSAASDDLENDEDQVDRVMAGEARVALTEVTTQVESAAPHHVAAERHVESTPAQPAAQAIALINAATPTSSQANHVDVPRGPSTRAPAPPAAYNHVGETIGTNAAPEPHVAHAAATATPVVAAPAEHAPVASAAASAPVADTSVVAAPVAAPVVTAPVAAPVAAMVMAPVVTAVAAPVAAPAVASAAAAEETAPVAVATEAPASEAPAPVVAPAHQPIATHQPAAPILVTQAPKTETVQVSRQALNDVVAQKGLSWVETDPQRFAQTQERIAQAQTPVRLGRERKSSTTTTSAPLKQVETSR
jgi:ribonuclease E